MDGHVARRIPTTIFDYEVVAPLGQGAGSMIYAVCRQRSNQLYALKHVVCREEHDLRFCEQLSNEYAVGSEVTHPGLRRSIELRTDKSWTQKVRQAALVMELVDGVPLDQQLPRTMRETVRCFLQVADALMALHHLGFVHCDLKPNNILRSADGHARVIDLGQACTINTIKQRLQGTMDYIAPEQVKLRPITPRTDVFNFGATLYWALAHQALPTFMNIARGQNSFLLDSAITPPHHIDETVPENLGWLVMECVRTDPLKRPEIADVKRRLEAMEYAAARHSGP